MSLTSYLAAPSRDLEGIRRGVRNLYSLFLQDVKYFYIRFFNISCRMTKVRNASTCFLFSLRARAHPRRRLENNR